MRCTIKIFIVFILLCAAFPVVAADRCYSPAEVEAEQLLRLHSELMVITVACRQSSVGRDLPQAYARFTRNNIEALHEAEATMIEYYKRNYGGKGIDQLDRLRTKLANEYGQQIANISAPIFCAQRRDKVVAMCDAKPIKIADEVEQMCTSVRTYERPCVASIEDTAKKNTAVASAGKRR